jgi:hypothetical protein
MRHWSLIRIECCPLAVGLQYLKPVARWYAKIAEHPRLIQETKLSQGHVLNVGR